MHPSLWILGGAISAALAVMIRASLSHGLDPSPRLSALTAANDMHLYHSLALTIVGLALAQFGRKLLLAIAGCLFATGLLLFCVMIYLDAARVGLGFLTPMGGISFITGWLTLAIWAFRNWRNQGHSG